MRVALFVMSGLLLAGGMLCATAYADPAAPAGGEPLGVFQAKGLTKVGFLLETAREAEVHNAANTVRGLKTKLTSEAMERFGTAKAIETAGAVVDRLDAQLLSLDAQMKVLKNDPGKYNRLVGPFNATLAEYKQRKAALDALRQRQAKIGDSQSLYGDAVLAGVKQADAAAAAYAELAGDPVLKAAIARYNVGAPEAVKLGPSGNFTNDAAFLKKCAGELTAEGVPVRMQAGVPVVEVIVNGKKHEMIWDSGASVVSLSTETAADLGLHATDRDRTIVCTVADGRQVKAKLIVVPEIHVGPFSAENIECLISPASSVRPPDLLGGTFQCHFLCRLDQQAGVLHLTPIDKQASLGAPGATPGAVPGATPARVAEAPSKEPATDAAAAAFAAVLADADAGRDDPAGRAAVPDAAARKSARKLILELMPNEFADTTLKGKRALGVALLARGQATHDDPAGCYQLLWEACAAGAESGDLSTVMKAVGELGRRYQIDTLAWKVTELTRLAPRLTSPVDQARVAAHGLLAVQAMERAENYADVGKMCALVHSAASASHSQQVQTEVRDPLARLEAASAEYALAKPAMDKLKTSPEDPSASLAVGRFECFVRGDFAKGLPLLARGTDLALKAAAAADLAKPTTGEACQAAGDGWWDQAAKEAGDAGAAEQCKGRAGYWYRLAVGQLNGLAKVLVQKRLASLPDRANGSGGDAIVRRKLDRINELVDAFTAGADSARTPMPEGDPLEGDVAWKAIPGGYSLGGTLSVGHNAGNHGKKGKDCSAKLKVDPGFSIEGGTLLVSKGSLDLNGEASKPIVLKNVHLSCELTGNIKASHVIFEDCTFTKEGPFSWIGAPSAKFDFKNCLLLRSNFRNLGFDDYGIKLERCTFASCKFPPRGDKPGKNEDSAKKIRHEWSHIADCQFYDCELSASVFWLPQRCNFFRCKATGTATFASPGDLTVELGLLSDERDPLLSDLSGRMTMTGVGRVLFTSSPTLYPALAFPQQ